MMNQVMDKKRDYFAIAAIAAAFINAFITYLLTMSPDVPFWDCGEFIACSYTLGVAHPPGTPLFLLIGRLFILLPLFENLAARVNFISVLTSAMAVALTCAIIIRITKMWFKEKANKSPYNFISYLGGITGALYITYSSTLWFSAVEAEVYGTAMLLMQIIAYLGILWYENIGKPSYMKYLLTMIYIAFLSIAIHMTVFLVVPAVFLFLLYSDRKLLTDWKFWVVGILLLIIAVNHNWFIIGSTIMIIAGLIMSSSRKINEFWRFAVAVLLLAMIGFSVHLYIPIRSAHDPYIDMNNPETLESFNYFMERKQYGQESMLISMLTRHGSWENQFGNFHRMGFWYYFKDQFSDPSIVLLPFLIGLFGIVEVLRRDLKPGGLLVLLLLVCTVGLIIYMNFSDGTRGIRLEVRDRDYFFTPGFMYFGMFIGIGAAALGALLYEKLSINKSLAKVLSAAPMILLILLSVFQTAPAHWKSHDRTDVHVPRDYAYNILNSCDKDAILFTNGDNDTYPLWYLQQVDSIRNDIRVVNLSLLNTDWYILQQKHQMGIPVPLEDDQIKWNISEDRLGNMLMKPSKPYIDPITKQRRYLSPNQILVNAEMVRLITIANNWKFPIYLSATVGRNIQSVVQKYLSREAMVYRITPEELNGVFDLGVTDSLLNKVYQYSNMDRTDVNLGPTEHAMVITYPELFIQVAEQLLSSGDTTNGLVFLNDAVKLFPLYYRPAIKLSQIYKVKGQADKSRDLLIGALDRIQPMRENYPDDILWHLFVGPLYLETNQVEEAIKAFENAFEINPDEKLILGSILNAYQVAGEKEKAIKLLNRWKNKYPNDPEIQQLYAYYKQRFR
ncbi:MAG: DUF2723 domain-containing protein [candidate division Zixibacteria bacterium]|nr:DUF2723 domain-containing protein [candidate division Zixibacteria bacterium]